MRACVCVCVCALNEDTKSEEDTRHLWHDKGLTTNEQQFPQVAMNKITRVTLKTSKVITDLQIWTSLAKDTCLGLAWMRVCGAGAGAFSCCIGLCVMMTTMGEDG